MSETILQFGAGRFLRAFVDRFVQHANDARQNVGQVVVVQSTLGARADLLNRHPDGYHVLVRGYEDGKLIDRPEKVRSITRALIATQQWSEVLEVSRSPGLRYVVTNATEAGYATEPGESITANPPKSLPGKLTQLLWARFQAQGEPLVLLPCELLEKNASKLLALVLDQCRQWELSAAFQVWVRDKCWWLNNLVDCIVTDGPADHPLFQEDPLLICAEPFALWAIERPAKGAPPLFTHPAIQIVDDLVPIQVKKVRILNGLHTAMVGKFMQAGFVTVQQVLADAQANRWVRDLLFEEIVPTLAYRLDDVADFADRTYDRLRNPFQAHKLADIALHHETKLKVRLQPTRDEYEKLFGRTPRKLVEVIGS